MNDLTVLVTAAGNQYMLGMSDCLKNNGERNIRLVGADSSNDQTILQMMDVSYQVPNATDYGYVDKLVEVCKKEKVDIVIPVMTAELETLVQNKYKFDEIGTRLSVSNIESISIANNKLKLYEFMQQHGIETPKFSSVRCVDDLEPAFKAVGYPETAVCIKATKLSGSRGIRIVDPSKSKYDLLFEEKPNSLYISYEELVKILNERDSMPEMMAMEALPGRELSVDLIADHGEIVYMAARKSNNVVASIPMEAILYNDKEAYEISRKVIKSLNLDGSADLDFRCDKDGKPILMEINPRVAATMAIFKQGGMNLPYLRIKQLLGEQLPEITLKTGVVMRRRFTEMYTIFKES